MQNLILHRMVIVSRGIIGQKRGVLDGINTAVLNLLLPVILADDSRFESGTGFLIRFIFDVELNSASDTTN